MEARSKEHSIDLKAYAKKGLSHDTYRAEFDKAVAEGRVLGPPGGGYGADYTKLNLARTRRLEKILKIDDEARAIMANATPQTWIVLTEVWCGDSAQCLPVINQLAELSPAIDLRIFPRDEHLELMDQYLTNGGRSIPKLIAIDAGTGEELFTWGPRPNAAQALVDAKKATLSKEELAEALHGWYNTNKGQDVVTEIAALISG